MMFRRQLLQQTSSVLGLAGLATGRTVGRRQTGTDWPAFQGDPRHTGFTDTFEGPIAAVETAWTRNLGVPVYAQPVRNGETIVVSAIGKDDSTGQLAAFGADGSEQWTISSPLSVLSTPTIWDGTVYQTGPQSVLARDAQYGTVTWSVDTPTSVFCSPLVVENTVYVGTRRGTILALSAATGNERWETPLDGIVSATPAAVDGQLFAATDTGTVAALDTTSGEQHWQVQQSGAIRCPLTVGDGALFVATDGGRLVALERETGRERWTFGQYPQTVGSPVYADDDLYWSGGSNVYAIDPSDGEQQWTVQTDGYTGLSRVSPSPVATSGTLYVTTGRSTLYALDRASGNERWAFEPSDGSDVLSVCPGEGRLYVGTSEGTIYALTGATNVTPELAFTYAPRDPTPGERVTLDASDAVDPDGPISTYRWDIDDDGTAEMTGKTVEHIFEEGSHSVTLEVVDSDGASVNTTTEITVGGSQTASSTRSKEGAAAYVDRVPGDEVGIVGGAAGVLGAGTLYLAARRRGRSKRTTANDSGSRSATGTDVPAASSVGADEQASGTVDETDPPGRTHPVAQLDTRFEDFEVGTAIGNGQLTEVMEATHESSDATIAIETLSAGDDRTVDQRLFDQFTDGVDVWERLDDHPNLLSVLASGTEPIPWVGLKHCTEPLTPTAVAHRSPEVILELMSGVLEGLHHGHRYGQYHGAVTPRNVMLRSSETGGEPMPVIGDWLVAAPRLDDSLAVAAVYPRFAAPEQVDPDGQPDARTDVYQAGILAHVLLADSFPIEDASAAYGEYGDKRVASRAVSPAISDDLAVILETALAVDPDDRYETALHFRDALKRS